MDNEWVREESFSPPANQQIALMRRNALVCRCDRPAGRSNWPGESILIDMDGHKLGQTIMPEAKHNKRKHSPMKECPFFGGVWVTKYNCVIGQTERETRDEIICRSAGGTKWYLLNYLSSNGCTVPLFAALTMDFSEVEAAR